MLLILQSETALSKDAREAADHRDCSNGFFATEPIAYVFSITFLKKHRNCSPSQFRRSRS